MCNKSKKICNEGQAPQKPDLFIVPRASKANNLSVPPVKDARGFIIPNKENKENMELLDSVQAAAMLGVTPKYLRICAKAGRIPYYHPLGSSKFVFKKADVERALVRGR